MPEHNDPVDIFNLDAPPPSASAAAPASNREEEPAPSIKAGPKPVAAKREGGGIKQWHILAGVGVILVGGIVLTSLPSGHGTSASPSGVLQPQAAMSSAAEHNTKQMPEQQSVVASSLPLVTAPPVTAPAPNTPSSATTPVAATPTVAATAATTATPTAPMATPNEAGSLAELSTQVGATQSSVKQLAVEVAKLTQAIGAQRATPRKRDALRQTRHAVSRATPRSEAVIRSLTGVPYTINTMGRGYAWLQAGNHVEIVQPGDRIGTTRVLAVDARDRRVITSDGIIK